MSIFRALAQLEEQNQTGALCTVIRSEGSTPRHVGSKMLVFPDGHIEGTVGGGEMESRVIDQALQAVRDGKPRVLSYSMAEPARGDPGVCGGRQRATGQHREIEMVGRQHPSGRDQL